MNPIQITLNQIRAHGPCQDGWDKILAARGGEKADFDQPFPLADALASNGLDDVHWALRCLPEHNVLWNQLARYYALRVAHLWDMPPVVRQYLETGYEALREQARKEARKKALAAESAESAGAAAEAAASAALAAEAEAAAWAAWAAEEAAEEAERQAQEAKLKQILEAGCWVEG